MSEVCAACKKAIGEGEKATRDKKGRHYHRACAQRLMQQRRAQAQQAAPAGEDAVMANLLAGAEKATSQVCPKCDNVLAEGTAICIRCGHNFQTGKSMSTRVERVPKEKGGGGSGGDNNAVMFGVGVFLLIGGLGAGARLQPDLYLPLELASVLIALPIWIWVLIEAFKMSVGQGLLSLLIPFYVLYWLNSKCENEMVKAVGIGAWAAPVILQLLSATGVLPNPLEGSDTPI